MHTDSLRFKLPPTRPPIGWLPLSGYLLFCAALSGFADDSTGLKVEWIDRVAHGTWGQTVHLNLVVRNGGTAASASGAVDVLLRARGDSQEPLRTLAHFELSSIARGEHLARDLACTLPAVADLQGRDDGDFNVVLAIGPKDEEKLPLETAHPIHIETRDERGRVAGKYIPRVYDLVSANAAPGRPYPDWLTQTGIRNSRDSVAWGAFEPEDGKWDEKQFGPDSPLGSLILQARKYDMTTIPTLLNVPEWAQTRNSAGRKRGVWAPPDNPERWAAFVDKVVDYYSKPPYNQRDWQIWNEAGELDKTYCFWDGTIGEYIVRVHNPAAAAIRKHFVNPDGNFDAPAERCRVVYGGLPDTDSHDGRYAGVLDLQGCGDLTDILDAHYVPNLQWFADPSQSGDVYSRWVKSGKARGCWITEEGWGRADQPDWLPGYYFNALKWALEHDWNYKDKYRVYFFHYYAAEENKGFFWINNDRKWPNGFSIKTLMDRFQGDLVSAGPARILEATGKLETSALLAGGRLLAMPFSPDFTADGASRIRIALKAREKVKGVTRINAVKGLTTSISFEASDERLEFEFAWKKLNRSAEGMGDPLSPICYLMVECEEPMTGWQ